MIKAAVVEGSEVLATWGSLTRTDIAQYTGLLAACLIWNVTVTDRTEPVF